MGMLSTIRRIIVPERTSGHENIKEMALRQKIEEFERIDRIESLEAKHKELKDAYIKKFIGGSFMKMPSHYVPPKPRYVVVPNGINGQKIVRKIV